MNTSDHPSPGQRSRFIAAAPPAPVPERPPAPAAAAAAAAAAGPPVPDRSRLTSPPEPAPDTQADGASGAGGSGVASDADVVRAGGSMAVATLISRITGFLRNLLIGASLGPAVGSAFNTANTLPNLITEIVLGAVLTSLVVPVLVRAEKEDPDRGAAFFRRLFTLSAALLIVVTVLSVIAAPLLTRLLLNKDGEVNVVQSTSFAFLLLPQIFFYGIFALFMAVLNTRGVFRPGAWAPVANNVVSIAVLVLYMRMPGSLGATDPSGVTDSHVLLLGVGTTLGVVVQAAILVPYLRKAGIDLRPLWGIDDRLRQFGGMAAAIIVYVAISQAGYAVTTQIASLADRAAPLIYQQHWLLLQVPYGIIGVTLLTAIMPRLSRNAADGDDRAVVADLNLATKVTFIALIPIVAFFTAFGPDIGVALFAYRAFDTASGTLLGLTLSFSAFTLLPYALVLLHLRVFYAREEAWTPTFIIAGITATKTVLSLLAPLVATDPTRVVVLLGAANGFGFVAGAVIGALLLRRKLGHLGTRSQARTMLWAGAASVVGVIVALLVDALLRTVAADLLAGLGSLGVLARVSVTGVVFLVATGVALSFSGLPEVQSLGRVITRIPGVSRVIRPPAPTESELAVEERDPQEVSTQVAAMDSFIASPTPAPMSAGVVRGPRLVPGAPVSDGRFRLLADHGSVPGARFWHARELDTGREVALTFVDTTGTAPFAPAAAEEAAARAEEVSRRTEALAGLPGIPEGVEVLSYLSGCLVVADWVPGTSLKAVADAGDLHPEAVTAALVPLTEAVAGETVLGLDNHARIRISTEGLAVLAFPAVLEGATADSDAAALASARALLDAAVADGGEEHLVVEDDALPRPDARPGFGAQRPSRRSLVAIGALSVGTVVLIASLTTYLVGTIRGEGEVGIPAGPTVQQVSSPVGEVVDKDQSTTWTGPGEVEIRLGQKAELRHLVITGSGGGAVTVSDRADGRTLHTAVLEDGRNRLDIDPPTVLDGLLLTFPGETTVAEVQVVGVH